MARKPRHAPPGIIYHVLNRSAGRIPLFKRDADYAAFQRILLEAQHRTHLPIFAFCIMNNHWHFVVRPNRPGQLTDFFRWLAHTHAMRWRVSRNTVGWGHLYQGRFKSFPVQNDAHFLKVCRYVERNPLTAGLVKRAQNWPWSSLAARSRDTKTPDELLKILAPWPIDIPRHWLDRVNEPLAPKELERFRLSITRSQPFGDPAWTSAAAKKLHLEHTLRPQGRPRKQKPAKRK